MLLCPMSGSGGCITRPSITTAGSQCQQIAAFVLDHPPVHALNSPFLHPGNVILHHPILLHSLI